VIAFVEGRLVSAVADVAVINVSGVGFAVTIPMSTRAKLPEPGSDCRLLTRLLWREDGVHLYGFATQDEAGVFDLLLRVSGVGPKIALAVLSAASPRSVLEALALQDVDALRRFPGVGRKTAERMVLELKDRLAAEYLVPDRGLATFAGEAGGGAVGQALQALMSLGYSRAEAGAALDAVASGGQGGAAAEDLIRKALQYLASR